MNIAIVGAEAAKFTSQGEVEAKRIIREILGGAPGDASSDVNVVRRASLVSGHCHLGGIDIWAEEIARELGCFDPKLIFPPAQHNWTGGYKPRNIAIAEACDAIHNIVVDTYPPAYHGMRFALCYHCNSRHHVKSGGCWTAKYAERKLGKPALWHVVVN